MNPANAPTRGTPPAPHARSRPSGDSQTRSRGAPAPSAPPSTAPENGRWGRCEDDTPAPPVSPVSARASAEEPRTGVVRRVAFRAGPGLAAQRQAPEQERTERERESRPARGSGEWRCLEAWNQPSKERRQRRNAKVTIVQLSKNGDLIRQNGPDTWLPEAGDFVQRMSRLLAQGLGFERCRSVCLKGASSALTVTEAGDTKVVVVSGPARSMANVLRRAGIE
jgi:hypothetical protein